MPRLVSFFTDDGLKLPGLLYQPSPTAKKVLIFLHGNGTSSIFYNAMEMNTIANELGKKDIAFFPFNNRGANLIKSLRNTQNERLVYGSAYELIKECIYDINGAIDFLMSEGFTEIYIAGSSTGANKICVYNEHVRQNCIQKYILLSGGDDTGLYYSTLGEARYTESLSVCKKAIADGNGRDLVPKDVTDTIISYQSLYDILNADGDYNIFPFYEALNSVKLGSKPLFKEYSQITIPTLVLYGDSDEYCYDNVKGCITQLKKYNCRPCITYKMLSEADHGFTGKEKELATTIADWL